MDVPSHSDVIAAIDAFQRRHPDIKDSRFGREATGEPGLVAGLRKGRSPTLGLLERIGAYMAGKDRGGDEHASVTATTNGPTSAGKAGEVSASLHG